MLPRPVRAVAASALGGESAVGRIGIDLMKAVGPLAGQTWTNRPSTQRSAQLVS